MNLRKIFATLLCCFVMSSRTEEEEEDDTVVLACEGEVAYLNCSEGQLIHIVKVFYGRRDKVTCATDGSTDNWESGCYSLNALDVVSAKCHEQLTCSIPTNVDELNDPCPRTPKYLTVQFECRTADTKSTALPSTAYTVSHPASSTTATVKEYTTQTSSTQLESPSCRGRNETEFQLPETPAGESVNLSCPGGKGHAVWKCNSTTLEWNEGLSDCLDGVQSFLQQFHITKRATLEEIKKLELETLTGNHIRELVEFFLALEENVKAELDLMNKFDKKEAVINIHETFFGISNFLLSRSKMDIWMSNFTDESREQLSSDIVRLIEKTSFTRARYTESSFANLSSHLSLRMYAFDKRRNFHDLEFRSVNSKAGEDGKRNVITLTKGSIKKLSHDGVAHVLFVSYSELHQILGSQLCPEAGGSTPGPDGTRRNTGFIGTEVISASVNGRSGIKLDEPVRYSLEHVQDKNFTGVSCSYWEFPTGSRKGGWMVDGCRVVEYDSNHTACECYHLTNFAVLMTVSGQMEHIVDSRHAFALSFVTYFGCIISIIALLASFLVFTFVRSIQCKRNTIHKNVVICLCMSELIFLIGITPTSSKVLCSLIAMCLHFLFLSTFLWMFLEGVQLYVMLVQVFIIKMSRALWYYVFSYGTATIIIIISASVNFNGYGTEHYCWLTTENGFIWAFVGPVFFIIIMNMIFLSMAVFVMCKHTYFANAKVVDKDSVTQIGSWVKGLITLVVLLGLTWMFGVFYVNKRTIVMAYIFTILNSFQGLFIFIFHCVLNEKVRKAFKRNFRDWSPMSNCLSLRSMTSSSSPRASSTNNNNNNLFKKRSCSTSVTPENALDCLYKKIHNRKISTSTQVRSSAVLLSQQRTSISFQQSSNDGNVVNGINNVASDASSPDHVYSEPTLEDPSAYLDPTLIRLDPDEETAWSPGYSHIEGSVADTDYLDDLTRPRRNLYTNEPQLQHRNSSSDEGGDQNRYRNVSPASRLDVKKYQLRRNTEGSIVTPYRIELNGTGSPIASYPKLVVLGRERVGRLSSLTDGFYP